ncbi:PepSY domain-containing protein [Vibrio bivalvicida]|uniref:PepSY domain-containing protein n=1 Tax=Vibrio bivalvicida TaxID=1276888 RepID=A0A177Y695_9VIBR|nr:PepSY domain-containing protein [Vibrio bivalvicida]OAJ96277.1 hypothetical protein APB76_00475 [Vibrio bivalvicida]
MKNLTTLSILIGSMISFSAMANSTNDSNKANLLPTMSAEKALSQIKKLKPASYESIELIEQEDGRFLYVATAKQQAEQDTIFFDATSGKDVTLSIKKVNFSLQEVLAQVGKTHQGLIVSAHSDLVPELGTIYVVEIKESYDEPLSTLLVIDAKTLKVIDSEKVDRVEELIEEYEQMEFASGMVKDNLYGNAYSISDDNDLELVEVGPQPKP